MSLVSLYPWAAPLAPLALLVPTLAQAGRLYRRAYFFNKGLANGLVMVHPALVALAYAFLALGYLGYYAHPVHSARLAKLHRLAWARAAQLAVAALVLGAWWAQQELNWGGWWAWDLVELGSLGALLIALSQLHTTPRVPPVWMAFSLLFFFFGLRLGLFSSVHSFVVGGHIAGQLSLALLVLGLCALLVLCRSPAKRAQNLALVVLVQAVAYVVAFFLNDAAAEPLRAGVLRLLLWLPLLACMLPSAGVLPWLPLPVVAQAWHTFVSSSSRPSLHAVVASSATLASLLGGQSVCLILGQGWLEGLSVCGEAGFSSIGLYELSPANSSGLAAPGWANTYAHTLTRPHLAYARRLSLVDMVQQTLFVTDHWLFVSIVHLSLSDIILGLCPLVALLLIKKPA